jgi:2-dehydropantoate 2-reductase
LSARIAICGAGALGSVYAGLLVDAGEDVLLLGGGPHAQSVSERGLELRLPDRTLRVPVPVAERGTGEIILFTAKSFGTETALARITEKPRLALSLQNGARKNDALVAAFGPATVAGACTVAAARLGPGVIASSSLGYTYVGEFERPAGRRITELVAVLEHAGFPAAAADDVRATEWSKLAQVAAMMGAQAQTRSFVHELLLGAEGQRLVRKIVLEVAEIAAANEIRLADLPGLLPVRTIAEGREEAARALLEERGRALVTAGRLHERTSLLQSLDAREQTEADAIHGALIELAQAAKVPVPCLEASYAASRG